MTGRYQQRFGFEFNAGGAQRAVNQGLGLPAGEATLAEALKAEGYATGAVGKWHLGSWPEQVPTSRGFDEFFGFHPGEALYIEPREGPGIRYSGSSDYTFLRDELHEIYRNTEVVDEDEFLTDAFTREAVDFIDRHKDDPFFLYVPYSAPHTPLQVTTKYYNRFPDIASEPRRIYAAMVAAMDDGVGRILDTLETHGLSDDTLVVFLSDNGCGLYTNACFNDPLDAGKLHLFEGGQRVPFVARFPGRIKAGTRFDGTTSSLDLFPTLQKLAGGKPAASLDGVDLMPYLEGGSTGDPHAELYWRVGSQSAMLQGKYKLVSAAGGEHIWLYDLEQDIGEQNNLAAAMPGKVDEMKKLLDAWSATLAEPAWPSRKESSWTKDGITFPVHI
jgi:arylsulfatase A-like enzyme